MTQRATLSSRQRSPSAIWLVVTRSRPQKWRQVKRRRLERGQGTLTALDQAIIREQAIKMEAAIIAYPAANMPPWAATLQQTVQSLQTTQQAIQQDVQAMRQELRIMSAQAHNTRVRIYNHRMFGEPDSMRQFRPIQVQQPGPHAIGTPVTFFPNGACPNNRHELYQMHDADITNLENALNIPPTDAQGTLPARWQFVVMYLIGDD
eukprot:c20524_g2_i1.p1 GENE.c20524_g2_i1~~c20524_g2_i1.p1  ORF type:complete len:206 (+),score=24.60 c20524_g2_i1:1172-1789(+)